MIFAAWSSQAQINVLLDIPGRLQWDNANGFCGETSIQMSALYYGNYICENITRTLAGGELLVAENDTTALRKLSLTYDEWDYNQSTPQYQNYLVWAKKHLNNHHPVIITVYVKGSSDPDYDHIIPAIGFSAASVNTYNDADDLIYLSCYDSLYFTRTFASIWDTRSMNGNGATYDYCIPKNVDYGVAVTGIKDVQNVTRPVHLDIDSWDEPNISLGASPKMLHATITIDSLTNGQQYALLRYNSYLNVPSSNFNPLTADAAKYFTASGSTKMYTDSFMSNTATFYRCIPYVYSGIQDPVTETVFTVFPNPAKNSFTVAYPSSAKQLYIYNSMGQMIESTDVKNGNNIAFTLNEEGVYFIQIISSLGVMTKKIIVFR
jgi:hypothetical protein